MTRYYSDVGECVDAILARLGNCVTLGLPIGAGKPAALANELYRRARRDPGISLTIFTGLTLRTPRTASDLQRRFLDPFIDRTFAGVPSIDYLTDAEHGNLPDNVRLIEFFFEPGSALHAPGRQRDYLCANYTDVGHELLARGVNVIAHLIASRSMQGQRELSLGCNPDVTVDLLPAIRAARETGPPILLVGQVDSRMPFMLGGAKLDPSEFDLLLENERYMGELFCPPNLPIGLIEHAIGLNVSALIRDGGTLQVGIGELGDAIVYALQQRHQHNQQWRSAINDIADPRVLEFAKYIGGVTAFEQGLFGCSEMFIDQLLDLHRCGVLKRRAFSLLPLERLLARGELETRIPPDILDRLLDAGLAPRLTAESFIKLQDCGVLLGGAKLSELGVHCPDGTLTGCDLSDPVVRSHLAAHCIGRSLKGGIVLQAAFLLGPKSFYAALRGLEESDRALFDMRGVSDVNRLEEPDRELKRLQRRHGRFVNSTMVVSLLGGASSDTLDDGRVVGGIGGQLNFVVMAHDLPDARSILCVKSTRSSAGGLTSNIVYANAFGSIPRSLRDIVVTEYGIADLRGRTDEETIRALLDISDSRFQDPLLREAKRRGKVRADYRIAENRRTNTPQGLAERFARARNLGLFSEFPFGSEFSNEEIVLSHALRDLQARGATPLGRAGLVLASLLAPGREEQHPYLSRMGLSTVNTLSQWGQRQLLRGALARCLPRG